MCCLFWFVASYKQMLLYFNAYIFWEVIIHHRPESGGGQCLAGAAADVSGTVGDQGDQVRGQRTHLQVISVMFGGNGLQTSSYQGFGVYAEPMVGAYESCVA